MVGHGCNSRDRLRQEDHEFEASLGNLARPSLKIKKKKKAKCWDIA
jgi:hypothetical protein